MMLATWGRRRIARMDPTSRTRIGALPTLSTGFYA